MVMNTHGLSKPFVPSCGIFVFVCLVRSLIRIAFNPVSHMEINCNSKDTLVMCSSS